MFWALVYMLGLFVRTPAKSGDGPRHPWTSHSGFTQMLSMRGFFFGCLFLFTEAWIKGDACTNAYPPEQCGE